MAIIYTTPASLLASGVNDSTIYLTWDNTVLTVEIEVQRKASGGTYSTIRNRVAGSDDFTDRTCSSNILYYYRIRYNDGANTSEWATAASAYSYPAAPTGLAATWVGKTATLTWTNSNVYSNVYYSWRVTGGTFAADTSITGTLTTVDLTMATENASYEFRVAGYISTSNMLSAYATLSAQTSELMPPTGMVLSSASMTSVKVDWTCTSAIEDGFELWIDGVLDAAVIAANETTYTKTGLTTDSTYLFKVRAKIELEATVYSDFCTEASIKVGLPPDADPVIGVVTVVSSSELTVAWTCAATNEDGFKIYRSTDDITYTETGTAAEDAESYADTGLASYTTYHYAARAYNAYGVSALSSTVSDTTLIDLDSPTGLYAEALSSTQIKLTFTVNAGNATAHYVERKAAGGTYTVPGTAISATATTYTYGSLLANTEYTFRIRAYSSASGTYGDYSVPVTKKTLSIGTDTVRRNEAYFAMGNILCIASETPQNLFESKWTSKPMDFSEADPNDANKNKTVYMVQLEYEDTYSSVPVVISLSNNGGTTWTTASETVGTGDLTSKIKNFHFSGVTGKYITLKISSTSATVGFTWTGIIIHYISRGEYREST